MASRLVDPVSRRRLMKAWASGWMRSWVMAIRCTAALVCRFPPRLSRNRCLLADQTGMGATPVPQPLYANLTGLKFLLEVAV